jgi:hypothetical protein
MSNTDKSAGRRTAQLQCRACAPRSTGGGSVPPTTWSQYPATQDVNYACHRLLDVSGIAFCDGTYIGPGGSFDISSNDTIKLITPLGVTIDASLNVIGDISCNTLHYTTLDPPIPVMTNAATVDITASTTGTFNPVFTDGSGTTKTLRSATGFTFNNTTGTVTATTFQGNLSGSASSAVAVDVTNELSSATIHYPTMSVGTGVAQSLKIDNGGFSFQPSTNTLTVAGPLKANSIQDSTNSAGTADQLLSAGASGSSLRWVANPFGSTGMNAITGGTITTFIQNGISYKAHVFTVSGALNISAFGTGKNPTLDMLIVGGGGSGGRAAGTERGGGGGAGCVTLIKDFLITATGNITVTVGAGGAAKAVAGAGNPGATSSVLIPGGMIGIPAFSFTIDAGGGGGGGGGGVAAGAGGVSTYTFQTSSGTTLTTVIPTGSSGGTAGGTGAIVTRIGATFGGSADNAGRNSETITAGGFYGGVSTISLNNGGAGGGGARGEGASVPDGNTQSGAGGRGVTTYITGSALRVGGGASGAGNDLIIQPPDCGVGYYTSIGSYYGGGIGTNDTVNPATSGTANTGGGGGGAFTGEVSGAGGSGIVIIRYKN